MAELAALVSNCQGEQRGKQLAIGSSVVLVTVLHLLVLYLLAERYPSLTHGIRSVAAPGVNPLRLTLSTGVQSREPLLTKNRTTDHRGATPSPEVLSIETDRSDSPSNDVDPKALNGVPVASVSHDGTMDYLPGGSLSVAPVALSEIDIPFPEIAINESRINVTLAVYIDENGTVREVRVENAGIPSALENAAMTAFKAARFHPGQIEGRFVRSFIRVVVTFESSTIDDLNQPH